MFADDLKLYSIYNSANGVSDLQQSLDLLVSSSNVWQLKINISKCHVLPIRSKSRSNTFNQYSLDGVLNNVSSTTDLGINIDSLLSFKLHISADIIKALQRVGIFFRGFSSRWLDIVRKTFNTYIRPLLEYNSTVWNPSHKYLFSPFLIKPLNCPNYLLTSFFTDHLTAGTRSRPNYDKLSHLIASKVNY